MQIRTKPPTPPERRFQAPAPQAEQPKDLWNDPRPWSNRNQVASLLEQRQDGRKTFSGFRWGWTEAPKKDDWVPHFQNTSIDTSKLKDVHFYVEHFFPAGHAALVFEFEKGAVQGADGRTTDRMVYSIEARKKEGDTWSPQKGLKKTMGMVHQLMTFEDAKQWVTRRQGASLETRRMNLSENEKKRLLEACLQEAVRDRTGEFYHTTRNSCYSSLQRVINHALPEHSTSQMSPLSAGLLMKPEAFLTSSYGTVLKNMGLFAREKARFYAPDAELHPEKRAKELKKLEPSVLKSLAEKSWFPTATRCAGAVIGAGLGYGLTEGVLAAGLFGYAGYKAGAITGDTLESSALRELQV